MNSKILGLNTLQKVLLLFVCYSIRFKLAVLEYTWTHLNLLCLGEPQFYKKHNQRVSLQTNELNSIYKKVERYYKM